MPRSTTLLLLSVGLLAMLSCHRQLSEREDRALRTKRAAAASESTRQQWAYLDRIRQRDPFNSSIERTLLTDQNEAGLVLSASVTADKVPGLIQRNVMKEMAQKFPHEDVTLTVSRRQIHQRKSEPRISTVKPRNRIRAGEIGCGRDGARSLRRTPSRSGISPRTDSSY